jgi:cathepsin F
MMKVLLAVALLVAVASAATPRELFDKFVKDYNKVYASDEEHSHRFNVFKQTLARIEALNADEPFRPHGINEFADLTVEEFKGKYLMNKLQFAKLRESLQGASKLDTSDYVAQLPSTFNWALNTSIVTPVKNQGECGSCWAFSATENIESVWALAGNKLVSLAPQQIVDCDTNDEGCNGGFPYGAYEYVISAGGLELETDYPYTAKNGKCKFNKADVAASIASWAYITQNGDESLLAPAVYNEAPLSICVDAVTWQTYTSGIITKNCGQQLDHCVQLTGWNQSGSTPYWIIRNSWGTSWGNAGFIYVEQGKNLCGLANLVTTTTATN